MSMNVQPPKALSLPVPQWVATPLSSSGSVPQSAGPVQAADGEAACGTCGFRAQKRTYWMPEREPVNTEFIRPRLAR